jgi:hypothetical protein
MRTQYIGIIDGARTWNVIDDDGRIVGTNQAPPEPPAVPDSVTAVQIRLWLVAHGITLEQVADAIAALPDETREATRIEWEYSGTVHRNSSTLVAMAAAFGMDSAAIDATFVEAAGM